MAVEQHCRWTSSYCHRAVQVGRKYGACLREWQRLVSYALTDAHAHSQLLIGTIAAFLQQQGVEDDLIRRHLLSPDPDRYVTGDLAGLLGRPSLKGTVESSWNSIGRAIAQRDSAE
ncbi:hypothetical protein SANT12839_099490 [Streptomyces antimycoticus]|uniref:Uncharacterized protein n=1 Tax=Streptomyces antimycoticus TaxID=68175 RepID=A0A4D4KRJ6_9ACTN|nr:hypothetical protein SANT12839_099490 [Streptomyces antimycoticus]